MTDSPDDGLPRAYHLTTYCARTPQGLVRLRIGHANSLLDKLLGVHSAREWAYVTACNPASKPLETAENNRRHEELMRTVRALGKAFFEGDGIPDDGRWKPERSLLILGMGENEAARLGSEFGQNAVVTGSLGGVPRLKSCKP